MGVYKKAVITDEGLALMSQVLAGNKKVRFRRACTSSYEYPDGTDFMALTALNDVKQEITPSDVQIVNENLVSVRAMFGNENVVSAYMIQNIGLYAGDGEREVLFAVSQAVTPDQMPVYNGVAPSSFIYNIQLLLSQAESISTEVDPAGTVTVLDLQDVRQSVERIYRNITVNVPVSWSANAPYTQEIAVPGLKVGDPAEIWSAVTEGTAAADAKTWSKMAAMISYAKINEDGKLMLACLNKKPSAAFKIRLKGVSRS